MNKNTNKNSKGKDYPRGNKGNGSRKNQKGYDDFEQSTAPSSRNSAREATEKGGRAGVNDKAWWTKNGQILKDSATVPQMNPVGGPLPLIDNVWGVISQGASNYTQTDYTKYYVPGMCVIEAFHGPGIAYDKNDAVNQIFLSQMEYVRSQITPNVDYDYADQGMTELAVGECYVWWANMVRAYGTIQQYVFENQYFPKHMVEALGFDFNSLRQNLTDFRMLINQMALALGAFPVPELDYYKRLMAVYGNLFVDSNSTKAQIYAIVPGALRVYDPTDEHGSSLYPEIDLRKYYRTSEKITLARAREYTWKLVDAIRNDDDIFKIFGNIKNPNTWGNRVFSIFQIPEDYTVVPKPDRDFLHMIMNGTCWYDVNLESLKVDQSPEVGDGRIIYRPRVQFRSAITTGEDPRHMGTTDMAVAIATGPRIMNVYDSDYIDPSDVIYWSRFMSRIDFTGTGSVDQITSPAAGILEAPISSGGIELFGRMHICRFNKGFSQTDPTYNVHTLTSFNIDAGDAFNNIDRIADLSSFNFHPTCWFAHQIPNPDQPEAIANVYNNINVVQQWETVATVAPEALENIQWGAVYSLWGIDATSNYSG